jgi:hypothetical protein
MGRHGLPGMFPHALWNVNERTLAGHHRTNNAVEGWHNGFQNSLHESAFNIFRFINELKKEQYSKETIITQLIAGIQLDAPLRKYQDQNARIVRILEDFHNRDIMVVLTGLSYNVKL